MSALVRVHACIRAFGEAEDTAFMEVLPRDQLLLQTLGEGEFGKVKLGLHSQWGEEITSWR
jgi:hypothetical protein